MGTFYTDCLVANHIHQNRTAHISKLLVDTGSENTWIAGSTLKHIGVLPEKKDVNFVMASGRMVSREIGFAVIRIGEYFTIDEVVFAHEGDLQVLGARTLEGLNLVIDPRRKTLVAAGPLPAAVLIEPRRQAVEVYPAAKESRAARNSAESCCV